MEYQTILNALAPLRTEYDTMIFLDTETTGLDPRKDRMIELAMICITDNNCEETVQKLIRLPEGEAVPPFITELTGIDDRKLSENGISEKECINAFTTCVRNRTVVIGHNLHFDIRFLQELFRRNGIRDEASVLDVCDLIDTCTILRDRKEGKHRLSDGIEFYGLSGMAENSHRAFADTEAVMQMFCKMIEEKDDIKCYINAFGYNPKYGPPKEMIFGVRYFEQNTDGGQRRHGKFR